MDIEVDEERTVDRIGKRRVLVLDEAGERATRELDEMEPRAPGAMVEISANGAWTRTATAAPVCSDGPGARRAGIADVSMSASVIIPTSRTGVNLPPSSFVQRIKFGGL